MSATKKSSFLQVTFGAGQGFSFSTCRPNPRCISFVVSAPQNFALRLDEAPGDKNYFCQDFCIPFSCIFITVIKLFSTRNNRLPKENHSLVPKAGVVQSCTPTSFVLQRIEPFPWRRHTCAAGSIRQGRKVRRLAADVSSSNIPWLLVEIFWYSCGTFREWHVREREGCAGCTVLGRDI